MAGYSQTSLPKKLGLKTKYRICVLSGPTGYTDLLEENYNELAPSLAGQFDWIQAFYVDEAKLAHDFATLRRHLQKDGQLWVSWPKKASKVQTTLDENKVMQIGLQAGMVDVKVAAIDDTWSGLKFVFRLKDRH
ncbi:MAG TPA: hypothetical protein VMY99_00150 [Nevskiaceae bacterium]|nr:hypothetical protein [Nevskiaceae bacterium]